MVIAVTVTVQGLTAGPLASALGLRRKANTGYVLLGANPLACHLAARLAAAGEVVELDRHQPRRLPPRRGGRAQGRSSATGSSPGTLSRARAELRARAVGVTTNESVNLLFARRVIESFPGPGRDGRGRSARHRRQPARWSPRPAPGSLFGRAVDLLGWVGRWRQRHVETARLRLDAGRRRRWPPIRSPTPRPARSCPLLVERKGQLQLVDDATRLRAGDVVELAVAADRRDAADPVLARPAWQRVAAAAAPAAGPRQQAPSAA